MDDCRMAVNMLVNGLILATSLPQVLISGAPVPVDLEDLRKHTNYSGMGKLNCI